MEWACEVKGFMNFLESDPRWPTDQKLIVGAHLNLGLRVVFHTRHQVVGTPYHRNGDAIYDTLTLMTTPDLAVARDIVRKRQNGHDCHLRQKVSGGQNGYYQCPQTLLYRSGCWAHPTLAGASGSIPYPRYWHQSLCRR